MQAMKKIKKDDTFQWSFIGVTTLAILLIVLALVGVVSLWVIALAIFGGIAVDVLLLYLWGKDYMSRY